MHKTLIIGAAGLVMLAGCDAVTQRTGLTTQDQICIGTKAAEAMQGDHGSVQEEAALVAAACGIDITALVTGAINSALVAAEVAD